MNDSEWWTSSGTRPDNVLVSEVIQAMLPTLVVTVKYLQQQRLNWDLVEIGKILFKNYVNDVTWVGGTQLGLMLFVEW